ncbi:MAG: PAS domain-containing sensor histidine kinase [Ginsengibacter sp.]
MRIKRLKDALNYAETITDALHEPMVLLYPDLTIRNANQAFYKTFQTTPVATESKLIYELDDWQWNIPELKIFLEEILSTKTSFDNFEVMHQFKNIGKKIMLLNARKVMMGSEKAPMILMTINDITYQRNYEQQLEKEKNIIAENKRLLEISRQKDDFFSMASHELKTPITSIKGFAQLLEHDFTERGNTQAAKMLSKMNLQIVKLTALIGDLLDATKIENDKLQYYLDDINLNQLIRDAVKELQLTDKTHTIKVNLVKNAPVQGDGDRIKQVLTNLISNAIKFSPKAKTIDITSTNDKKHITVCVKDFGMGITKEMQGKIFERFFRVDGAKDDNFRGLGLGLYISAAIIKHHKGTISVKSAKGKGATFCFKLPLDKS